MMKSKSVINIREEENKKKEAYIAKIQENTRKRINSMAEERKDLPDNNEHHQRDDLL
jgi:hypothetical protein